MGIPFIEQEILSAIKTDKKNKDFHKKVINDYGWTKEKYEAYFLDAENLDFFNTEEVVDFMIKYDGVISEEITIMIILSTDMHATGLNVGHFKEQTKMIALAAVKKNYNHLQYLRVWDEELCIIGLEQNGMILADIIRDGTVPITERMCITAVRNNGLAVKFIEDPSEEVCITAIKQNPQAINFIDPDHPVLIKLRRAFAD